MDIILGSAVAGQVVIVDLLDALSGTAEVFASVRELGHIAVVGLDISGHVVLVPDGFAVISVECVFVIISADLECNRRADVIESEFLVAVVATGTHDLVGAVEYGEVVEFAVRSCVCRILSVVFADITLVGTVISLES